MSERPLLIFGGTDPFSSSFLSSLNPVTYTKCFVKTERMSELRSSPILFFLSVYYGGLYFFHSQILRFCFIFVTANSVSHQVPWDKKGVTPRYPSRI